MAKSKGHVIDYNEPGHNTSQAVNGDGGACLVAHIAYRKNCSCSYRWQGKLKARTLKAIYDDRSNSLVNSGKNSVATSRYETKDKKTGLRTGRFFPKKYGSLKALPKETGDWAVDGPNRSGTSTNRESINGNGSNFTESHIWPYWHNSHHIIPKGLLNSTIEEVCNKSPNIPDLLGFFRKSLLCAKYNVHFMVNVIILPMDCEVAKLLSLPRHLVLENGGPDGLELKDQKTDHKEYSNFIKADLLIILTEFKATCESVISDSNTDEHTVADATLCKKKLERLSGQYQDILLFMGRMDNGVTLDAIEWATSG